MYVFSHLHKAAGTTIVHLLRRSFGRRHFDTIPGKGHIYLPGDLLEDSRRFGTPVSIAGHGLRPHVDYGELNREMHWYTIIRNPLDRCISHYQHQIQKMSRRCSFLEWISRDLHRNWMVYFYGGSDSLQKAVDAVSEKKVRVIDIADGLRNGVEACFPEPLLWRDFVANPARNNRIREEILGNDDLMAELEEANRQDIRLFDYMKKLDIGKLPPLDRPITVPGPLNTAESFIFRNLLYRPMKRLLKPGLEGR